MKPNKGIILNFLNKN